MFYQAELKFMQDVLAKCRVQLLLVSADALLNDSPDLGLRRMLGIAGGLCGSHEEAVSNLRQHIVYLLRDAFYCNYLFLRLPRREDILLIGPFTAEEFTSDRVMQLIKEKNLPLQLLGDLENYFGSVPVVTRHSHVFAVIEAFCETIWPGISFEVADLDSRELEFSFSSFEAENSDNPIWKMELMEKRYEYENKMIDAVAHGQVHKAQLLFPVFSALSFERRLSDPLRNMKNYCIIMNTLLRKAAESGGVHPIFLDKISSEYARKIEGISSTGAVQLVMMEMFEKYCRLVRKHSLKDYSPPVRKTIIAIESSLGADLNLSMLAGLQGISASYLSRLFKKETAVNLTEYINQRRIEHAENLLLTTKLQIQTIAQHCGILDVQYFSRLFKKIKGCSPFEFRKANMEKG